jgi:hypothetical protein
MPYYSTWDRSIDVGVAYRISVNFLSYRSDRSIRGELALLCLA